MFLPSFCITLPRKHDLKWRPGRKRLRLHHPQCVPLLQHSLRSILWLSLSFLILGPMSPTGSKPGLDRRSGYSSGCWYILGCSFMQCIFFVIHMQKEIIFVTNKQTTSFFIQIYNHNLLENIKSTLEGRSHQHYCHHHQRHHKYQKQLQETSPFLLFFQRPDIALFSMKIWWERGRWWWLVRWWDWYRCWWRLLKKDLFAKVTSPVPTLASIYKWAGLNFSSSVTRLSL